MPELPEVENIALGLRNEIINLSITEIRVNKPVILHGPHRHQWRKMANRFKNHKITTVTRRGKRLILCTDNNLSLIIQLGMTGRFLIQPANTPEVKHTHFVIKLSDNNHLRFIDPRRFGRLYLLENFNPTTPDPTMESAGMGKLGPEPFGISKLHFRQIIGRKRVIKNLLLDQTRITGLGNIYVDESLFAAGIHPTMLGTNIPIEKIDKLRVEISRILNRAIACGGTTFSDYRNAYGEMGSFKKMLKVYQRTSQPCYKCKTPIEKIVISARSSHFCPKCQPEK